MQLVERGRGTPLVLIPGLQGRWEWMTPLIDALAASYRVITFSLCDEPSSAFPVDPARGVANYVAQVEAAFARTGLDSAVLVGVSYGGPIAAEFAVRHPERVRAVVLISALPLDWEPDARARFYIRAPLLLSPLFFVDAPLRASREIRAALPRLTQRVRFSVMQTRRLLTAFLSPTRMARRIRWLRQFPFSHPAQVRQPVLVITGEPGLDRVVDPQLTRRYLNVIPQAQYAMVPRTGHLGILTKPAEFRRLIEQFLGTLEADVGRASA